MMLLTERRKNSKILLSGKDWVLWGSDLDNKQYSFTVEVFDSGGEDFLKLIALRECLIGVDLDKMTKTKDCNDCGAVEDRYVSKEEFESFKDSTGSLIDKIISILSKLAFRTR